MKKIAITTGDPAGIGSEITSKSFRFFELKKNIIFIVYGKIKIFKDGNPIEKIDRAEEAISPEKVYWIEIDDDKIEIGKPTRRSGEIAYKILERCSEDLNSRLIDAVVTCPVSKEAIHQSQPDFIGHTEFFAKRSGTKDVIMSFWGPHFNLALLTTHLAVAEVPGLLTKAFLETRFRLIYQEVCKLLKKPKIAMLAINPHAGESGIFGKEDILVKSVLDQLKESGIDIDGPFPADTFFSQHATKYNLVISAFHDQGLIPFKMLSMEEGVNVTLGLPYVRTSVDHGTAFDIAGTGKASEKSLLKAILFAEKLLFPTEQIKKRNYSIFAKYYDTYMSHVDYDKWVKFILEQYNKIHKENPKRILELACGTANVSCQLVKKGLQVDASDISAEMLKIAARKPFSPNLSQRDMIAEFPANTYDLVILLFDSINYVLQKPNIKKLFNNVYNSLQKSGLFIFDLTTPKNCESNFDGFINIEEDEDEFFIHQSDFDSTNFIQKTHLTFFLKKGFLYSRKDEIHEQKIYKADEMVKLIGETNFQFKGIYSIGYDENLLNRETYILDRNFARLFFVLEK
ncbi:MAG: 4-hydroxythreonine-4-phosphate dehydrogenase PdxA [Candidatus Cloacimonetes bacterium]|nr:4-hydroxythreonine-4-phosphate dehydrogenase PdxA [Candidatus Cloacimonadota bacterium]